MENLWAWVALTGAGRLVGEGEQTAVRLGDKPTVRKGSLVKGCREVKLKLISRKVLVPAELICSSC